MTKKRNQPLDITEEERNDANVFYKLNSLMGYTWAQLFVLIGGRQTGKSYALEEFVIRQFLKKRRKFIWLRLSKISVDKMLANNCDQLFDPDLVRKYNLDLVRVKQNVYQVLERDDKGKVLKKRLMGRVLAVSEMAKEKGVAFYDHEYKGWINVICDEFVLEKSEKKTFDVAYNLANTLENICRNRKDKMRVVLIGNMCGEIAEVLGSLNFLPQEYGRYKLKRKRAIIEYLPVTEAYKEMRKGAIATLILGDDTGNFNNKSNRVYNRIYSRGIRELKPVAVIKFSRDQSDWFTLYEKNVIRKWNKEKCKRIISMRPYIDEVFIPEIRDEIFSLHDAKGLWFNDIVSATMFEARLSDLKPRG